VCRETEFLVLNLVVYFFYNVYSNNYTTEVYSPIANNLYVAPFFGHLRRETFDKEKHNIGQLCHR